tara:strand:+ start:230 stop:1255 length:1026 start_codon:yes stop_codon:yes gene_type:complete
VNKPSIGILMTSRNTYHFTEMHWINEIKKQNDINKYPILNIDEDSYPDQKKLGKEFCKKHDIVYMDREERGMFKNLETASNYFEPLGVKFILWSHNDSWPLQNNFYNSLNRLVASGEVDKFGTIGFNGIGENILGKEGHDQLMKEFKDGKKPLGVIARCHIAHGDAWIAGLKTRKTKHAIKDKEPYLKPHACPQNTWWTAALNIELYRKYIDTSHQFFFHKSWDDICLQFLMKGVYNLILPSYYISHRQDLKREARLPKSSVRLAYKNDDRYHSTVGFPPENWEKQWGWTFGDMKTFDKIRKRYKRTLVYDFYKHDRQTGPLKTFDIKGAEYDETAVFGSC